MLFFSETLKSFPDCSVHLLHFGFNPFHVTGLLRYPLKTSENQRFSDVFMGYWKRPVAWNGLRCSTFLDLGKSKILSKTTLAFNELKLNFCYIQSFTLENVCLVLSNMFFPFLWNKIYDNNELGSVWIPYVIRWRYVVNK